MTTPIDFKFPQYKKLIIDHPSKDSSDFLATRIPQFLGDKVKVFCFNWKNHPRFPIGKYLDPICNNGA